MVMHAYSHVRNQKWFLLFRSLIDPSDALTVCLCVRCVYFYFVELDDGGFCWLKRKVNLCARRYVWSLLACCVRSFLLFFFYADLLLL